MKSFSMKMPSKIFSGENAILELEHLVQSFQKVAVFTDHGIQTAGLTVLPLECLKKVGVETVIFDDIVAEPSYEQVQQIVDRFKGESVDAIVAIGGGSVMDTAKLASVSMECTVKQLLENPMLARKTVTTIMIPTTAGTGSEATPNAIVAVPEKQLKVGIVNEAMVADYVILDAMMIKKLPRSIAAATGVDALAHAIECYTSNKATPFSDLFAMKALELIFANIEHACDDIDAMEAKNNMLLASFYAGVAITCSGTTAVHALSYPLGGKYHMPHGVANAILLAPVMRFNESTCRDRLAQVYDRVTGNDAEQLTAEDKSKWIVERLQQIVSHLDIPTSLSSFSITSEDIDVLVVAAMDVKRLLNNNMRTVTPEDVKRIYLEII